MQLALILAIAFAIAAGMFALQNNVPVSITFAVWHFDSSLAIVLLLALFCGAFIAGLVSTPAMIRARWEGARLRRQVADLEADKAAGAHRIGELEAELARHAPAQPETTEPQPYVGLKTLIAGTGAETADK